MKMRQIYRIIHYINPSAPVWWDVYASNYSEAVIKADYLKQSCINNGGWTPCKTEILNPEQTAVARERALKAALRRQISA